MGITHNQLAHGTNALLLSQLRNSQAPWATARLTTNSRYWQGVADYPKPDGAFEDRTTNASLALEFKPPGQPKREYITGLGQALSYLRSFEYSALVVPELAYDGFRIADYLGGLLQESYAAELPIALFSYQCDPSDATDLRAIVTLRERKVALAQIPKGVGREVFWGYWRDLSQYEVQWLLELVDSGPRRTFEETFENFWSKYPTKGRAKTWEGGFRKRKSKNAPGFKAEERNDFYSLLHSGLINRDGSLTETGYELLHLGKVYGPESVAFKYYLARQILDEGRHLELIFWIDETQRNISRQRKRTAAQFYAALDRELFNAGVIPHVPSGAKTTFLRDEPKLWNKLGLLIHSAGNSYFHPGIGLVFNWRAIIDIMGD
jgi:hypothetical protein